MPVLWSRDFAAQILLLTFCGLKVNFFMCSYGSVYFVVKTVVEAATKRKLLKGQKTMSNHASTERHRKALYLGMLDPIITSCKLTACQLLIP